MTTLHKEITNIQQHHEQQMITATNNITILQDTHHKEIVKTHETITQQSNNNNTQLHVHVHVCNSHYSCTWYGNLPV